MISSGMKLRTRWRLQINFKIFVLPTSVFIKSEIAKCNLVLHKLQTTFELMNLKNPRGHSPAMKRNLFGYFLFLSFLIFTNALVFAQGAAWQVSRYDVNATISDASQADRALSARVTVNATNVGSGAGRQLTARINPQTIVNSVTINGAPAKFTTEVDGQTKLLMVRVALPETISPGAATSLTFDYRLPVTENTGLAAVSMEGSQFLPLAYWYPTPNTPVAPRGADYAPFRLTINAAGSETAVSAGRSATGGSFELPVNSQPFFLTGRWDAFEGAGEARGVSAFLFQGASAEERKRAEDLIALAANARSFYASVMGAAPDVPIRLVAVRRGAGFDAGGTLLLDGAVFRRAKTDNQTALSIGEAVARLWVGGATAIHGEGAGALREGLVRFLAMLFVERHFGRDAANAEMARLSFLYAPVAMRDAPLSQSTAAFETYFTSVANKGALAWRLIMERGVGREQFFAALRREFDPARAGRTSLAGFRASLGEKSSEATSTLFESLLDKPTDTDLLIGKPRQEGGEWVASIRNLGSLAVDVNVAATTERGERVLTRVTVPAKGDVIARFKTTAPVVLVEVDPEKFYPQMDFARDVAPWAASAPGEMLVEARSLLSTQPARAESIARDLIARVPHMQEARIALGRALVEQRKLPEAEKVFKAALDLPLPTPATLAWANIGLGEVALRNGQNTEAVRRFEEAVRVDAEYASTLAARAARIRAESTGNAAPAIDEAIRAAVGKLDAALRSGKKAELDAVIIPGELADFSKGIVGSQPELWQSRILRTEQQGTTRFAADVEISARTLGRDQAGTAVLVFTRTPAGLRLADIQFFEVR